MKVVIWNERARDFVRGLEEDTKREIGVLLLLLQMGKILSEPQSKAMKSVHKSAYELKLKDGRGQYRVIYVLALEDKILIPHAFHKKTQKTPKKEIELSIGRLREMFNENQ